MRSTTLVANHSASSTAQLLSITCGNALDAARKIRGCVYNLCTNILHILGSFAKPFVVRPHHSHGLSATSPLPGATYSPLFCDTFSALSTRPTTITILN